LRLLWLSSWRSSSSGLFAYSLPDDRPRSVAESVAENVITRPTLPQVAFTRPNPREGEKLRVPFIGYAVPRKV
jgi:hypothetical protein